MNNEPKFWHKVAAWCDANMPIISHVGRGIKGNSVRINIKAQTDDTFILESKEYDEATKSWTSVWTSENIHGGKLVCEEKTFPYAIPPTYHLTFTYYRGNEIIWQTKTPALAYVPFPHEPGVADVMYRSSNKIEYKSVVNWNDFKAYLTAGIDGNLDIYNIEEINEIVNNLNKAIKQLITNLEEKVDNHWNNYNEFKDAYSAYLSVIKNNFSSSSDFENFLKWVKYGWINAGSPSGGSATGKNIAIGNVNVRSGSNDDWGLFTRPNGDFMQNSNPDLRFN